METLTEILWLDATLAQLILAHNHGPGIEILAAYANRFPPPVRDQLLDAALLKRQCEERLPR